MDSGWDRGSFVSGLACSGTGVAHSGLPPYGLSAAGLPLLVRYDLDGVRRAVDRDALARRPTGMWRYRELLPVERAGDIVSLGEPETPLVPAPALARRLGLGGLWIKDESRLPTASFKARGLAMAVTMAKSFGVSRIAMPTNGNAGAALAAYAARAGIEAVVFCPADTPEVYVRETALHGAAVHRVDGLIDDCGRLAREDVAAHGGLDVSTLKEPYRIEGKKTMGLEVAEQLGWRLPDAIVYPTGGGTGLIGMWKAFAEIGAMGWIDDARPRMVAVQAEGCAPIVRAFETGAERAERWENAATIAAGIRVPAAIGDFLILRAVRESGGFALAVPDAEITAAQAEVARTEGLLMGLEGAATYAGLRRARADGRIGPGARVVLFNCGSALKSPMPPAG